MVSVIILRSLVCPLNMNHNFLLCRPTSGQYMYSEMAYVAQLQSDTIGLPGGILSSVHFNFYFYEVLVVNRFFIS